MSHSKTGLHTLTELSEWMRGLRYFGYIPPLMPNSGDLVEMDLIVAQSSSREALIKAFEQLKAPGRLVRVFLYPSHLEQNEVNVVGGPGDGYDFAARHFDVLRELEPEIIKTAATYGATPKISDRARKFGVVP